MGQGVIPFSGSPQLPPEVWNHVLKSIPKSYLPQLLGVCSLFHDIIIRDVFSSIKIYFIGVNRGLDMLNSYNGEWIEETAQKLMYTSWKILNHICQEPRFARIVKSMTIIAFGDGLSIFEKMTVANTLSFLPHLQTFRWIGTGPEFSTTVAKCLPSHLRKLVVQSSFPLESLQHLVELENLQLSMPWFFPDDEEAYDAWIWDQELLELHHRQPTIDKIFKLLVSPLQSLRISASHARGIPVRILNNLRELVIVWVVGDEDENIGLDLIFRHATLLQSLTMVGLVFPGLLTNLPPSSSGALPHLNSFRFSLDSDFDTVFDHAHLNCLRDFLSNRKRLRRLHLRLPLKGSQRFDLWDIIEGFPTLEVLGLHTGSTYFSEDELRALLERLPMKLRAFNFAFCYEATSLISLIEALGKHHCLTFLHLYGVLNRLPILLEDLATEIKGLRMIGLNRALWNVDRVGSEILTTKWPRWKTKFFVEDDFHCEDDAWLFEYN